LACALCHYPYFTKEEKKIIIVDAAVPNPFDDFKDKTTIPDQRVVSLTFSSARFLREMGVWDLLNKDRIGEIRQMQVWEAGGKGHMKFNDNPETKLLGYTIENKHLIAALHHRLKELGNCELEFPQKITNFSVEPNSWARLTLEKKGDITARLAIGSDGPNSIVKKKAGIPSWGWSSDQFGIVCTIKTSYPTRTAWQRFMTTGPIAILPLWDEYCSIVWSCEPSLHEHLMKLPEEEFVNELNNALSRNSFLDTPNFVFNRADFEHPPVVLQICNKRMSFPLRFQQANRYVDNRVALIGDAAHNVHPLAGQGLNLGLTDAAILANTIVKNLKAGLDIGDVNLLQDYEYKAKVINYAFMGIMESLKRSYEANDFDPFIFARNISTAILNNLNPVKSFIVQFANGYLFHPEKYEWKESRKF